MIWFRVVAWFCGMVWFSLVLCSGLVLYCGFSGFDDCQSKQVVMGRVYGKDNNYVMIVALVGKGRKSC